MSNPPDRSPRSIIRAVPALAELWASRWTIVVVALVFGVVGGAITLLVKPLYRAQVTLLPVENKGVQGLAAQLGALGGLADLAGIDIGSTNKVEPTAVLSSREFARRFIEDENLVTVLLADKWDAKRQKWKKEGPDQPDIRDAVEHFDRKVRKIGEDRRSGLLVLTIEWSDPQQAAHWANLLAERINTQMRDRAIAEASRKVEYLRGELEVASQVSLQQSISRLLESQLENIMAARGNREYAFRVIDPARVPKKRFFPKRTLLTLGSALMGGLLSCAWVLLVGYRPSSDAPGAAAG